MKKVINITLGGIVFAIEQDAYDTLASYLEDIKKNLTLTDDAQEIVGDIESAIAEKFSVRKRNERVAVTDGDVAAVVSEMGSPADFRESEDADTTSSVHAQVSSDATVKKRLYRDTDDAIVAGVASGLAKYFDIDPVIVRLAFVISIFFNGLGILAYSILWLVIPKAETTAQKYAMRGEKVTLKEITEQVKKNLKGLDEVDMSSAKSAWTPIRNFLNKVFIVLGIIVLAFVRMLRYLGGFLVLMVGAFSLAALVSVYSVVLLSDQIFIPTEAQTAVSIMVSSVSGILAIASSFVVSAIPLLFLILIGGSLLVKRNLCTASKTITLVVVWIIAIVLAVTASALQVEKVMHALSTDSFKHDEYQVYINLGESDENEDSVELRWGDEEMSIVSTESQDLPDALASEESSIEFDAQ